MYARKFCSLKAFLVITATVITGLSACANPPPIMLPADDGQVVPTLAPMLERATPAVVNIATEGRVMTRRNPLLDDPIFRRFFNIPDQPRERRTQSLGSGVVVDARRGYVITNHHVVEEADVIQVGLRDGRRLQAKLIGSDPETDVAVIQVPASNLTALPLADSSALRVGDFVVAIGNPFGLGQTVTSGIVSALGRKGLGIQGYEDFIQTDASINPGNSGGALVNLRGELVGVNTAIIAPSGGNVGIGFAIPSNMVRQLMNQLVEHGGIKRGRLGVSVQDLTPDLAQSLGVPAERGAVVTEIQAGSAAQRAGLREGDVVVALDGKAIDDANTLRNAVGLLPVGEQVQLEIMRNGQPQRLRATISEATPVRTAARADAGRLAGAQLDVIKPGSRLYGRVEGVLVERVAPGSPADRAGLRAKDVIVSANREPVTDPEILEQLAANDDEPLLLNVQRGKSSVLLLIR